MRNDTPITIIGNLTDDPELKYSPNGHAITRFRVAVTKREFNKERGQWDNAEPSYYTCEAWRQLAENVCESLTKGARVIVAGTLDQEHWKVPAGAETGAERRSAWILRVDAVGPSLEYATAKVTKATRSAASSAPSSDQWSSGE